MASLVISSKTISVRQVSRHLEVISWKEWGKKAESRMRVPLVDIERIVVVGRPSISFPVLYNVIRLGIPCYFLNRYGRWIGCLNPDNNMDGNRRLRQFESANDSDLTLNIARRLVKAKLRNSRRVLQRLSSNRGESAFPEQKEVDAELSRLAENAEKVSTLDELRGYEGLGAAKYFKRLARFFPTNLPFNGRSRRPPKDPANALLSWTYSILLGEVEACVRKHGLDACLGFLHGIKHGSPSLARISHQG